MLPLVAVLDADVLFGRTLRDVLLYTAAEGLLEVLREAFDEAEVVGYEAHLAEVANHPKDRHVAAAAVRASTRWWCRC